MLFFSWYFIILLFLKNAICEFEEVIEKIASQTMGFLNFAMRIEDDYRINMHLHVKYHLYAEYASYELFTNDREALSKSPFNKTLNTIIIIHGYTDNKDRTIIKQLRQSLVANVDSNIIVVDWHKAANQIYFTAVANTLNVGYEVGDFLRFLEYESVHLDTVHVIGHSLGAQIAGIAGDKVDGRLGRITGLDPAGPLFEFISTRNNSVSLDSSDAQFVDVIHTAIGTFGAGDPLGHADFYPNEGAAPQPGCNNLLLSISCSHIRSIDYFIESINGSKLFLSKRCLDFQERKLNNCLNFDLVPMGYHLPPIARGNYYLQTNPKPPFAMQGKFYKDPIFN